MVWLGREGRRAGALRHTARAVDAGVPFPRSVRRVTVNHDRNLFGGGAALPAPTLDAGVQRAALRVRRAGLHRRVGHVVPDQARRARDRLVGVDARGPARLHQPGLRRLPLPRARAQRLGRGERGSRPTRSPSCRPGTARGGRTAATRAAGRAASFGVDRLQRRRVVGKERERAQFAEARLRAESAEALARVGERGQEERRAAQRDRPRDHRRRSTSTRSSASSTSA